MKRFLILWQLPWKHPFFLWGPHIPFFAITLLSSHHFSTPLYWWSSTSPKFQVWSYIFLYSTLSGLSSFTPRYHHHWAQTYHAWVPWCSLIWTTNTSLLCPLIFDFDIYHDCYSHALLSSGMYAVPVNCLGRPCLQTLFMRFWNKIANLFILVFLKCNYC